MEKLDKNQLKLNVLFYNIHLFGRALPGADFIMRHIYGSPLLYEDEARTRIAARKINKLGKMRDGCDIVGLCELWDEEMAERIRLQIQSTFPYCYRPAKKSRMKYAIGSGLTLFSKYPIRDLDFIPFKTQANIIEKNCQKGILKAVVEINENFPVSLLLSHFQAGQGRKEHKVRLGQLEEMGATLDSIRSGHYHKAPIIVMGDFNVIAEDERGNIHDEYIAMTRILRLKDVFRTKFKSAISAPGYTSDGSQNGLLKIFHRNTQKRKRLDFIFSNNYRQMSIENCSVEEFRTNNPVGNGTKKVRRPIHHLSDHFAVQASFVFAPSCTEDSRDSKYSGHNSSK
jgi:endonuclease/exonuclease/phosphatase family metal-dependent hydrolase